MDGRVDLVVAAAVKAVAVGLARADGDGSEPAARELGVAGEPARAGDLADEQSGDRGHVPGR
jgi:hypothetical protein